MLSIFRTNQIIYNVIFIFYLIIIRLSYFFIDHKVTLQPWRGLWSDIPVDGWIGNGTGQILLDILFLVIQAVLINSLVNNYRMTRDQSLFPGLLWVLINSLFPEFFLHSPLIMANLFFLLGLSELFSVYKKAEAERSIFNIGFWFAVASLFYSGYVLFFLLAFIGMNILRAPRTKEYLILIVGICVPYLLTFTYYYWNDGLEVYAQNQFVKPFGISFSLSKDLYTLIKIGISFILILLSLSLFSKFNQKQSIQNSKYIQLLYWIILFAGIMVFIQDAPGLDHFLVCAIPLSIFLGMFINQMPSGWAEFFHLLILVNIFIWQFGPLSK